MAASSCQIIAHRGASGHLPEHTLEAYALAIEMGADIIEPDVVLTKDGVPIARHESVLNLTTDVADHPEFAARRRVQVIAGQRVDGWFTEDFTAAEIATLRARERFAELRPGGAARNDEFAIPTLAAVIELLLEARATTGRNIGLYPELKQVEYFAAHGLDSVTAIAEVLNTMVPAAIAGDIILQSFEPPALRRVAELYPRAPRVQLLGAADPDAIAAEITPAALARIAEYAQGIGVAKYGYIFARPPATAADPLLAPGGARSALIERAHAAGLFVHVYTFRAENQFLPPVFQSSAVAAEHGDLAGELRLFIDAGMDAAFIDYPDIGRAVCAAR
ncbi:MAG: glycerophosphodiester phosphodiesterase family protein [Gammaproteobacteria bacterium]|jgi:glycerophosphoryl diester phosphodiesterase|nr:glycerophosphodiester phosphodiesterase family protein [Gammaproteobacteria bacterium]